MQERNFNHIILEPDLCYGCGACVATCPKKCLKFEKDVLGFRRVQMAKEEDCVSCGKCSSVCPISSCNKETDNVFRRFYGQIKNNKILMESSSGGAFSAISELWIKNGGVVWGVSIDEDAKASFICVDSIDALYKIRGSKYVEVNQPMPFELIRKQLNDGKKVLVSGVPCQIQALSSYLGRKYEKLLLVDLLCYGVQSPLIWEKYLSEINPQRKRINSIFMRYKVPGWENYAIKIEYRDGSSYIKSRWKDPYLLTYAKSLYNRESCGNCRAKQFARVSDITLGDFWQIDTVKKIPRDIKVNQGISVILANSLKGQQIINDIQDSMNLFEIPENTFLNMKARYSECHSRSIMSEQFVKDTEKNGFSIAAHRMTNKSTLVKEWSRFRWLSFKRLIKRYL